MLDEVSKISYNLVHLAYIFVLYLFARYLEVQHCWMFSSAVHIMFDF